MLKILLLLFIIEMSKLPKPILKVRESEKDFDRDDFLEEYSKVVDGAIKIADEDLR